MRANFRLALIDLAIAIGRETRDPEPMPYGTALDLLGTIEDKLYALADCVPEVIEVNSSTLSGSPDGYLPTRHPRRTSIEDWQQTSNPIPPSGFSIRCSGCSRCAIDKHLPLNALRTSSQTEDFTL